MFRFILVWVILVFWHFYLVSNPQRTWQMGRISSLRWGGREEASAPASTLLSSGDSPVLEKQARTTIWSLWIPPWSLPPAHLGLWAFQSAAVMKKTLKKVGGKVLTSRIDQETFPNKHYQIISLSPTQRIFNLGNSWGKKTNPILVILPSPFSNTISKHTLMVLHPG